jgi:hypothetical protein
MAIHSQPDVRFKWRVISRTLVMAAILASCIDPQENGDRELAGQLADHSTRERTITALVTAGNRRIPLLLSWTRKPPEGVDVCSLYVGLADVFGRLRITEAIPFLIEHIASVKRTCDADFAPWMKAPAAIEEAFPAMAALIQIGPEAGTALIRAADRPMIALDRRAAIFAIARIKGVPEAHAFLTSAIAEAYQERRWAEEGLKNLTSQQ